MAEKKCTPETVETTAGVNNCSSSQSNDATRHKAVDVFRHCVNCITKIGKRTQYVKPLAIKENELNNGF